MDRFLWDDKWHELKPEANSGNLPNLLKPDVESGKITLSTVRKTLMNEKNGFALVAGLFGMTLENLEDGENYAHAGRLRVETAPIKPSKHSKKPQIDSQFGFMDGKSNNFGPNNAVRHITWRGPVDRITHSAKDGGLHTFLEFSSGQTFDIQLRIINPTTYDLALLALWQREINCGYIRFGGLTSIGRGKLSVVDKRANLFWIHNISNDFKPFLDSANASDDTTIDDSIWKKARINLMTKSDLLLSQLATILGKGE